VATEDGGARLKIAVDLARRNSAYLTGIFMIDIPGSELFFGAGMPFTGGMGMEQMVGSLRADAATRADLAGKEFHETLRRDGVEGEWRVVEGDTVAVLAMHARYADLTVLGQPNDDEPFRGPSADAVLVNVMMSSGRPVLAVPYRVERVP
jgi:hypothetical protein